MTDHLDRSGVTQEHSATWDRLVLLRRVALSAATRHPALGDPVRTDA